MHMIEILPDVLRELSVGTVADAKKMVRAYNNGFSAIDFLPDGVRFTSETRNVDMILRYPFHCNTFWEAMEKIDV